MRLHKNMITKEIEKHSIPYVMSDFWKHWSQLSPWGWTSQQKISPAEALRGKTDPRVAEWCVCDFQPQILGGLTGGVRSHNLGRGSTTQSLMNGEYHFQEKCLRACALLNYHGTMGLQTEPRYDKDDIGSGMETLMFAGRNLRAQVFYFLLNTEIICWEWLVRDVRGLKKVENLIQQLHKLKEWGAECPSAECPGAEQCWMPRWSWLPRISLVSSLLSAQVSPALLEAWCRHNEDK